MSDTTHPLPTRAELVAALADPDPGNVLARQISAALDDYALQFEKACASGWQNPIVLRAPGSEVEAFAFELFEQELADQGVRVAIKGHG